MSKAPWERDPFTGLSHETLANSDFLDATNPRGELEANYPDCNVWNLSSMAAIVGKSPAYIVDKMFSHPDGIFHTHQICIEGPRRHTVLYGTHTTSLQAARQMWEALPWGKRTA